jgi:hypothetical protein
MLLVLDQTHEHERVGARPAPTGLSQEFPPSRPRSVMNLVQLLVCCRMILSLRGTAL